MPPKPKKRSSDPSTILDRFRAVLFSQWEELLRMRRVVIKKSNPDDIHDLRVSSRRFRAALELFSPFMPKRSKKILRKNVRSLTRTLGSLRNIDEAELFFRAHARTEASPGRSKLCRKLSKLRSLELKRFNKELKSFDYRHLDRTVHKTAAGLNEASIESSSISLPAYFSDVSIEHYQPIHLLLSISTTPDHCASRHALRIAIKKWRYFLEIIANILDRDYTPFLDLLKEYQSILGLMNDIAVFEVLLGDLKLPLDEREHAQAALMAEDRRLLEDFTTLVERKPLAYTFQL